MFLWKNVFSPKSGGGGGEKGFPLKCLAGWYHPALRDVENLPHTWPDEGWSSHEWSGTYQMPLPGLTGLRWFLLAAALLSRRAGFTSRVDPSCPRPQQLPRQRSIAALASKTSLPKPP